MGLDDISKALKIRANYSVGVQMGQLSSVSSEGGGEVIIDDAVGMSAHYRKAANGRKPGRTAPPSRKPPAPHDGKRWLNADPTSTPSDKGEIQTVVDRVM